MTGNERKWASRTPNQRLKEWECSHMGNKTARSPAMKTEKLFSQDAEQHIPAFQ